MFLITIWPKVRKIYDEFFIVNLSGTLDFLHSTFSYDKKSGYRNFSNSRNFNTIDKIVSYYITTLNFELFINNRNNFEL